MNKTLVSYRLSDRTRDNIQSALDLYREEETAHGRQWLAYLMTRTRIIEKAIDCYLSELLRRAAAREQEEKDNPKRKILGRPIRSKK